MLPLLAATLLLTGTGLGPARRCVSPEPLVSLCQERMGDGSWALALLNASPRAASVDVVFRRLGVEGRPEVRNVTGGQRWGVVQGGFAQRVEAGSGIWFHLLPAGR